jgi:antitoxin (DNA-binding transcriptional repressor) of toxin-antitoxin stability system
MIENKAAEVPMTEARVNLSRLARDVADNRQITYLTINGFRVAAIVAVADAEDIERLHRGQQ